VPDRHRRAQEHRRGQADQDQCSGEVRLIGGGAQGRRKLNTAEFAEDAEGQR
jgi:hypothetical protein